MDSIFRIHLITVSDSLRLVKRTKMETWSMVSNSKPGKIARAYFSLYDLFFLYLSNRNFKFGPVEQVIEMYRTAQTATGTPPLWFYFGTFVVVTLIFFAVTYGPVIQDKFKAIRRRVKDFGQTSDKNVRETETPQKYYCVESCGSGPFPKVHDKKLHEEAKHGKDHGFGVAKNNSEEKTSDSSSTNKNRVRLRDFVDKSTTPDWLKSLRENSEDGITLQKPEGGKDRELEAERLRKCWKPVLSRLKQQGVVEILETEHPLGRKGPRGPDAARLFKSQAKRMDLDFDVSIELGKPSVIRKE